MSTQALLAKNPAPTRAEISKAIAGNLCRCTGYHHIFASIEEAAHTRKEHT
jgi:carbon-monoxide dehydrogenase small subunit